MRPRGAAWCQCARRRRGGGDEGGPVPDAAAGKRSRPRRSSQGVGALRSEEAVLGRLWSSSRLAIATRIITAEAEGPGGSSGGEGAETVRRGGRSGSPAGGDGAEVGRVERRGRMGHGLGLLRVARLVTRSPLHAKRGPGLYMNELSSRRPGRDLGSVAGLEAPGSAGSGWTRSSRSASSGSGVLGAYGIRVLFIPVRRSKSLPKVQVETKRMLDDFEETPAHAPTSSAMPVSNRVEGGLGVGVNFVHLRPPSQRDVQVFRT